MGISCSNYQYILRGIDHQQQGQQNENNHKQITKQVFDCEVWKMLSRRWFQKIIQIITITNENERKYFFDGQLLRIELRNNQSVGFLNYTNLEQLYHLNWSGKYGLFNQKVGRWITTWKGEMLRDAGGWYSDDEKKQGLWIELTKNYRNKAEVYESGYYIDDQRYGIWNYIYNEQLIDAGCYNYQGRKNGKWTELSDQFSYYSQVKYTGEYKNGKKVGLWEVWYQELNTYKYNLIGCGSYDGDGNKIGQWIELSEGYKQFEKITYTGQYKSGKKIGRWDIWFDKGQNKIENTIGGGLYDKNGTKIGKWIEVSDGFQQYPLITYIGQYRNGNKIGRWDIFEHGEMIGGGSYDEVDSIKIGRWIEPSDYFGYDWQTIYNGEYKNGKKVDRWDIEKRDDKGTHFKKIGGGSYDKEQGSIKIGFWCEFDDHNNFDECITTKGEYKNGNKIGRWETLWKSKFDETDKLIGFGSYDELSSNKFGKWIEISDTFQYLSQVTYIGEYINGVKVGRWDIYYQKNSRDTKNELIGGGSYNDEKHGLIKIGKWIELGHSFNISSQVTFIGEYKSGKRVGRWEIWFQQNYGDQKFQQVGGGSYDEEQGYIKVGRWIELTDNFNKKSQVAFKGEYKNCRKIGRWDICCIKYFGDEQNQLVGGGQYSEQQGLIKCGLWIDLCQGFLTSYQCTLTGQYKNSRKVGIWYITFKVEDEVFWHSQLDQF
ncbi:unnamed protein product [Paramecium pentaurelia]|uniref:Uncharacterized protein n=1 Tax=Paramecium pentaurelia TaxID=43138 RepID=A0A8S1Y969_9CILI|nr:unnamed protein product [Paramecium pentaurelia]